MQVLPLGRWIDNKWYANPIKIVGGDIKESDTLRCALLGEHDYQYLSAYRLPLILRRSMSITRCSRCNIVRVSYPCRSSFRGEPGAKPLIVMLIHENPLTHAKMLTSLLLFYIIEYTGGTIIPMYWDNGVKQYVIDKPKDWGYGSVQYKGETY